MKTIPGYMTAVSLAKKLKVDESTVTRWCKQGRLAGAVNLGKQWVIPQESLKTFTRPKRGNPMFVGA